MFKPSRNFGMLYYYVVRASIYIYLYRSSYNPNQYLATVKNTEKVLNL